MLRNRAAGLAILLLATSLVPASSGAQQRARDHTYSLSQFFNKASFGNVGLSYHDISQPQDATEVTVLPVGQRLKFRTKTHPCQAFIDHQHPEATTNPVYVGIQIVSLFKDHQDPQAVYVQRNDAWVSRISGKPLGVLGPTRLVGVSLDQFAQSHRSTEALDRLEAAGGRLSDQWHAKVPEDDSAATASLAFWARNPIQGSVLPTEYKALIAAGAKDRVENRLMKFIPTRQNDPKSAPSFNFWCNDPLLQAIVLRVHLPGSAEFERTFYIDF
jgi:hypothetical protein